ncbi:hypothetical protein Tco_0361412 [Tanacetum coccineum]
MTFKVIVKEIGTWTASIENDLDCNDSESGQEGDDQSCNMYENHNDVLDDFIEQVVEQKVTLKSTEDVQDETNGVNLDGSDDIGSKPLGFKSFIKKDASPILNLKKVDEKRGNINTLNIEFGQITTSFYYTGRILTLVRLLLKLFHSWFDRIGFDDVVKEAWNNFSLEVHGSSMSFHDKLRGLKSRLKLWYSHTKDSEHNRKLNTLHSLRLLDEKIDAGQANDKDKELRVKTMLELEGLDKIESMNLLQSSD